MSWLFKHSAFVSFRDSGSHHRSVFVPITGPSACHAPVAHSVTSGHVASSHED